MRTGQFVVAIVVFFPWVAMGQGDFTLSVANVSAPEGLIYQQDISLAVFGDSTVSGWSFSICHDSTVSDICGGNLTQFVFDINQIGPLFFVALSIDDRATVIPGSQDGLNCGLVLDQSGFFFFPNNTEAVCVNAFYVADPGTAGSSSTVDVCSTVGSPNVEAVVVCCGGMSIPVGPNLTAVSGTVDYIASDKQWTFSGSAPAFNYDVVTGNCLANCSSGSTIIPLSIANTPANSLFTEGAGFSFALSYDPTFVTVNSINAGPALTALNGGSGPDVFMTNNTGTGISVECQNTALPMIPVLPYNPDLNTWAGETAVELDTTMDTSSLIGVRTPTTTTLAWDLGLGAGATNAVTVICGSRNLIPLKEIEFLDIPLTFFPLIELDFIRGDCNDDGVVNIADAIWTVSGYLMVPPAGPEGPCAAACDVNNDFAIDVADVTYTLAYRFASGPAPASPFPNCGIDAMAPCDAYVSCP